MNYHYYYYYYYYYKYKESKNTHNNDRIKKCSSEVRYNEQYRTDNL